MSAARWANMSSAILVQTVQNAKMRISVIRQFPKRPKQSFSYNCNVQDMAIVTGGIIFGDKGTKVQLKDIQLSDFGSVGKVTFGMEKILFEKCQGYEEEISRRTDEIKKQNENSMPEEEKKERIVCLDFKISILKISGASNEEL